MNAELIHFSVCPLEEMKNQNVINMNDIIFSNASKITNKYIFK